MLGLRTQRLTLRRWLPRDAEPFARMNADARVMEYFPAPLTRAESDALIGRAEAHFEQHGFGPFAVEITESGLFAGFVGLMAPDFTSHFTPCVEIGWRLAAETWNQGFATEGARALIAYGFQTLGLREIVSFTVPANIRSRRVMEKLGMTRNPSDDFDHPRLAPGHPLRRHVLYRLASPERQSGN